MRSVEDILIDDGAKILPVASLALRLGRGKADDALIRHAVCELGYIHAAARSDGMMVELRAAAFSLVTLIGALFAITDRRPSHILLTIFWDEGRRSSETFDSLGAFAARAEILAQSASVMASSGFG